MSYLVLNGNNVDVLKQYPDNYFDAVVTDPPYGLGKEPDAQELMKDWIEKGYHEISGKGFMGKEWDAFVPQPVFWKEVFRVLKHGGHIVAFFGTRTYDWGVMAMRFAGFEVRDCIQWLYGCLSDDTEILTKSGYIQYHKFIKLPNFEQQEILIYDAENDIYKWEKPERWNEYNIHKDTCYRIKSDSTDQIVSRNHRCLVEREGKIVFIQAELLSKMEYVPTLSNHFYSVQESQILQSSMQRTLSGSRVEETRTQGKGELVKGNERNISVISNGGKESILEGWNNLSEKERVLFGGEVEICEMPEGFYSNGEERRICGGVSVSNGEAVGQTFIEDGVCTPHRPQSYEQQYIQLDAICNEQRTQAVRMGRSYSTTLATITPIEYSGVIFCPTVSTSAFVARRNGKVFLTGNSGFPKSHNISKAIDKMYGAEREVVGILKEGSAPLKNGHTEKGGGGGFIGEERSPEIKVTICATDEAKEWDGWGSALKPANEPIVLARKPLEKGLSIAENVLKWGTGGINIDGCRIAFTDDVNMAATQKTNNLSKVKFFDNDRNDLQIPIETFKSNGRFPANIILTHHPECECKGLKKVKAIKGGCKFESAFFKSGESNFTKDGGIGDADGNETIEDWNCHEDCPIKILDEQSGTLNKQGVSKSDNKSGWQNQYVGGNEVKAVERKLYLDTGGASRFFYVAKASKSERNRGLEGFEEKQTIGGGGGIGDYIDDVNSASGKYGSEKAPNKNFHPTVKPVKLMQYLIRLVTPPNGKVLDPFCGSGTTGIACKLEGVEFVGIEQDAEYCKIAEARINNFTEEPEVSKSNTDEVSQNEDENPRFGGQMELFS